ncbi:SDR family oxidoreductase [Agrobacterium rhizogenes]|nr:SDR family oxidoreductase [Rhizobium rhizogenes]
MSTRQPHSYVFGASTGIGAAVAKELVSNGFFVHGFSRSFPSWANEIGEFRWHRLDFNDPKSVGQAIQTALDASDGEAELMAYSAIYYGTARSRLVDMPLDEWYRQFNVNLHGLAIALRALLPALEKANPGIILNVSSEVVFNGGPSRAGYAATKAAAANLISSVAQEYSSNLVRTVQVLPIAMVDTPGVRRRRRTDFDYSSYMQPDSFRPITREIVTTKALYLAGRTLVVNHDGSWRDVATQAVPSQSRAPESLNVS